MKITVQNIESEYPKLGIELPEPLAADKFEKLKTTFLPNYDKSEVIAKMVDTFVQKLNEAIAKAEPARQDKKLNPYIALYKGKRYELYAETSRKAQQLAAKHFKAKKEYEVSVYLADDSDKPKQPKKTEPQKPESKPAPAAKPKKEKKAAKPKAKKPEPDLKSHFEEDERLIRRFHAAVGKERSQKAILGIYRDLERRITESKVNRMSTYHGLIIEIQSRLKRVLDFMAEKNLDKIRLEPSDNSKDFFAEVEKVANAYKIRASVGLLKRFIGIEGETSPAKDKVKNLYAAFERAFKQNKLTDSDIYADEIKEAMQAMKSYLDGNTNRIKVSPASLNGLSKLAGLGKPKAVAKKKSNGGKRVKSKQQSVQLNGVSPVSVADYVQTPAHEPIITNRYQVDITPTAPVVEDEISAPEPERKPDLSGLFTPITAQVEDSGHEKIELPGDLGKFLGYVERYEYSILLRGEKGAGKTRMMYQMMNTFAKAGFKVGCFSLEIGKQSNIVKDMRNAYLSPTIAHNVFIADSAPNGLDDIRNAAKQFDVICVDSWGKIPGVKADDFDKLRKEFPKTMFIIIFQSTTNGTARGGSMPEYDAGIVIQVANGGRAYCEKNRYSGDDLTYLVFQRKLEQPEPVQ